jgi:hypothetical protein
VIGIRDWRVVLSEIKALLGQGNLTTDIVREEQDDEIVSRDAILDKKPILLSSE